MKAVIMKMMKVLWKIFPWCLVAALMHILIGYVCWLMKEHAAKDITCSEYIHLKSGRAILEDSKRIGYLFAKRTYKGWKWYNS